MKWCLSVLCWLLAQAAFSQDDWAHAFAQAQESYQQGLPDSYELAGKALVQAGMAFGTGSPSYADNLRLLTLICYTTARYQSGIRYAVREVAVRQQLGDTDTPRYGQAVYNLALMHLATHAYDTAKIYLQQALKIFEKYPAEKASFIQVRYQLGRACQASGQWALANTMYRQVIQTSDDSLCQEVVLQAQYQQALLQIDRQHSEGTAALYTLKQKIEQQQHTHQPVYFSTLLLLASQEEKNSRLTQAVYLYEQAKTILEASRTAVPGTEVPGPLTDSLPYLQVLAALGRLNLAQGDLPKAEGYLHTVYAWRKRHLKDGSYWASVDHKAQVYRNKPEEAITFYEENIREVRASFSGMPYEYIVVLNNLALMYEKERQAEKARQHYHQAIEALKHQDTTNLNIQGLAVSVWYNTARNYQQQRHYDTALYYYKKAADISRTFSGQQGQAYMAALSGLAALYQDMGRFTEAEIFFREALQRQESISGSASDEYSALLNNLALLMQAKGDEAQAEKLLLEVVQRTQTRWGAQSQQTMAILSNLGLFYLDIAAYKEARPVLEKILAASRRQGDRDDTLIPALTYMARLEMAEARYTQAEPLLKQAAQMAEAVYPENHPERIRVQLALATFYLTLGNYTDAETLLQETRQWLKATYGSLHRDYAAATLNLAILYQATRRDTLAEAGFREALEIDRKILGEQHPDYAIALNNLASFYQNTARYAEAEPLLEKSLAISRQVWGRAHPNGMATLLNLGLLYQELGQYEKAETMLNEVIDLRKKTLGEKHPDYAYALYGKAVLYHRLGRYEAAVPIFRQVADHYTGQIRSYFPALSEKEKSAFYKRIEPILNAYRDFVVDMIVNHKYGATTPPDEMLGELYNVQLVTKAMLLDASSQIRRNIFQSGNSALMLTYESWIKTKEKLAHAYRYSGKTLAEKKISIRSLESNANELEKQLSAGSALFAQNIAQQNLTWQHIRQRLTADEAAVEMIRGYREKEDTVFYVALVLAPTMAAPRLVVLPSGKEMEGKHYFYYKNAIKFKIKDQLSYDLYWSPVQQALPPQTTAVYIAPDGVYNKISLNSLFNTHTQRFVLDEMHINMLSSTRELAEDTSVHQTLGQRQAYLFGYPNYRHTISDTRPADTLSHQGHWLSNTESALYPFRNRIRLLPGTRQEVNDVDIMLQASRWSTFKFTENMALEETIKQVKNPDLLHIATHGYFLSDLPVEDDKKAFGIHLKSMAANPLLRSGLLLAGAQNTLLASETDEEIVSDREAEDGILTAYEAMNLHLNGTDLVVLSACETGAGELRNGEGVYGLQRAFLVAGANSVLMSLWKVNDVSTTALITTFYRYWLSGQDKFTALRNAQLAIKETYPDPYYWGAFVLMGR